MSNCETAELIASLCALIVVPVAEDLVSTSTAVKLTAHAQFSIKVAAAKYIKLKLEKCTEKLSFVRWVHHCIHRDVNNKFLSTSFNS